MAVLDFVNDMNTDTDNNMYTAGILMDLSKAFNIMNHDILLDKLKRNGLKGVSYACLQIISQIGNKWFLLIQHCRPVNSLDVACLRKLS